MPCRAPERVEHEVATLIGQLVLGIALGHADVVDHDQLRHDPVLALLAGKGGAREAIMPQLSFKNGPVSAKFDRLLGVGGKV
jgi:hypothetical protein